MKSFTVSRRLAAASYFDCYSIAFRCFLSLIAPY